MILYGFRLGPQWAFPKRKATQRLVPYSENKGYASNPRRFNQSGENSRTDKANKLNSDMSELTALVKKLLSRQEDQINRLIQLEAQVGASPHAAIPQPQRSQGSSDTEVYASMLKYA